MGMGPKVLKKDKIVIYISLYSEKHASMNLSKICICCSWGYVLKGDICLPLAYLSIRWRKVVSKLLCQDVLFLYFVCYRIYSEYINEHLYYDIMHTIHNSYK